MTTNMFDSLSVRYDLVHNNVKREELIIVREKLENYDERVAHCVLIEENDNKSFIAEYNELYDLYFDLIEDIDNLGLTLYLEGVYLNLLIRDLIIEYSKRFNLECDNYVTGWHKYYDSLQSGCKIDFFYYKQSHRTYQY